jgi:hypothetical protein
MLFCTKATEVESISRNLRSIVFFTMHNTINTTKYVAYCGAYDTYQLVESKLARAVVVLYLVLHTTAQAGSKRKVKVIYFFIGV